jgi:hypothetical protein
MGEVVIDRYRLRHSGGLVVPLVHLHLTGVPRRPLLLDLSYDGKVRPEDWPLVERSLAEGLEIVSFDARALGENRMQYKAVSIDDPELAVLDENAGYASPLSGVLANHAYNALLTGRPYFLELIEDAEIVARFAREKLGASHLYVSGRGPARTWAAAVARAVPDVEARPETDPSPLDWARRVEGAQENWPIHELLPGGAYVR